MEKAEDLEVLATSFEWDDLGSWDAVARHATPDAAGNVVGGDDLAVDATGCLVRCDDGPRSPCSACRPGRRAHEATPPRRAQGPRRGRAKVYEALRERGRRDLLR
jgi:hypothetical protein